MDLGSVLKKVGAAIIKDVVPGGGLVVDLVNAFLPENQKLPAGATGAQAMTAISSLPADQQVIVMSKQLDVELAEINGWSQVVDSLAQADASGSSTRPDIAVMMAKVVAFAVVVAISSWAIAILTEKQALLKDLNDSWGLLLTILGTPTALLRAYFGMRSDEKKSRYSAATGGVVPQGGLIASLAGVLRR